MSLSMVNVFSITSLNNIDKYIEYSPFSSEVVIIKRTPIKNDTENNYIPFGYEEFKEEQSDTLNNSNRKPTRAIINFTPERPFLAEMGIEFEDSLPIIGYFKNSDQVKRKDLIEIITMDTQLEQILEKKRLIEVTDIKSVGNYATGKHIYVLTPYRGTI